MPKFLLVGTQFALGAAALLASGLPQRAPVALVADPDNPYDSLAVRVLVARSAVVESPDLSFALAGAGLDLDSIVWPAMLGHLGASRETKAAKRTMQAGLHFATAKDWHSLREAERTAGTLEFQGGGSILIDVAAQREWA